MAYEHLMDPAKKRKYDSTLPFDDSLPKESELKDMDDAKYFTLWTDIFNRNARFANKKPVPKFGNM